MTKDFWSCREGGSSLDYEMLKNSDQMKRDNLLREELGAEKCKILDKYLLRSNSRLYWERFQDHYPVQEYFSHKFAKKASSIGIIFHIYHLCYAKVKYFEQNWENFAPYVFNWQSRSFIETGLYDMEYVKHRSTGIIIDLRNLARINRYEDFVRLCNYLEEQRNDIINPTYIPKVI